MITIHYFASAREKFGVSQETVQDLNIQTVAELKLVLARRNRNVGRLLCAVNHHHADDSHPLQSGDEVAFFPTITGG